MNEITHANLTTTLEHFQCELDAHFRTLRARRHALNPPAPVFALEHGLAEHDLRLLRDAVIAAHRECALARASRGTWLPFVVHAAEVGYVYDGVEFWPIYLRATPGWQDSEYERDRVRDWFKKFVAEYDGAVPQGAWATTFRKIAWPITHAVLPRYLQVQLARMLYDYRTGWPSLLDDPHALGVRLHSWSRHYGERLEKFCQNTELLGHVAVALLLSGEDERSPYIESTTLERLVASLNSERQSRRWLRDARRSAATVRTRNFQLASGASTRGAAGKRLPAATDPKLQLNRVDGVWKAYAVLPDLKPLQHTLPIVYDELRKSRAVVAGARQVIPSGGLLFATAPVELASWPLPTQPFLQLQRASQEVNLLIADQCRTTSGPWWIFLRKAGEPAGEVKGKFVRPGRSYCVVGAVNLAAPDVAWCEKTEIAVEGVHAYSLDVPATVSESESRALTAAGISVISDVSIRPVGVVASAWDGEGSVEWLAGEPALIVIYAQHAPHICRLTINGDPYYVEWPPGQTELFLALDGLAVGTHEVMVTVGDPEGDGRRADGTLVVTIRDPEVPTEGASLGERIRLRTSPAQPSLPELWDGRASVEVDGPEGVTAELLIRLFNDADRELGSLRRNMRLPVSGADWRRQFRSLREAAELARHYDEADVAELSLSRSGIGFASLTCERGFRGLRWVVTTRHRDGGYAARLIDRTDGEPVTVEFYSVEQPVLAEKQPAEKEFVGPPRGGLLWASNGQQVAGQIIPPDPNQLLRIGPAEPLILVANKSPAEVNKLMRQHRLWKDAELPAHPFGVRERQRVLDALTRALVGLIAGGRWARFEEQIVGVPPSEIDLNQAQSLVGDSAPQRAAAKSIATHLWQWDSSEALIRGFADAIAGLAAACGITHATTVARFLLQLSSSPGELLDWDEAKREKYMRIVLNDPVLIRAARFAVLGTVEEVAGGVG